ncbi:MAG: phosphomannomutase [Clostridia bacterium]|nr:phosphomannomutase [Clostridia bacterium]
MSNVRVLAFDLDGTLTQHKTKLCDPNLSLLQALDKKYTLLMVGAGACMRIFTQMNGFPIDIIGNYGMQYCRYDAATGSLREIYNEHTPCDRASVDRRITELRQKYGYTEYAGDNVEYHASGCVTFPLLGTSARIEDKLSFDPDRSRRRVFYQDVVRTFPEYTVFIGGSSSFDFAPKPYNKYYALDRYCKDNGLAHDQVVYVGDDYGTGGNDEAVYASDFRFICIDDYTRFGEAMEDFLTAPSDPK